MGTRNFILLDRGTEHQVTLTDPTAIAGLNLTADIVGAVFRAGYSLPVGEFLSAGKGALSAQNQPEFLAHVLSNVLAPEFVRIIEYFALIGPVDRVGIFSQLSEMVSIKKPLGTLQGKSAVDELQSPKAVGMLFFEAAKFLVRDFLPESPSVPNAEGQTQATVTTLSM